MSGLGTEKVQRAGGAHPMGGGQGKGPIYGTAKCVVVASQLGTGPRNCSCCGAIKYAVQECILQRTSTTGRGLACWYTLLRAMHSPGGACKRSRGPFIGRTPIQPLVLRLVLALPLPRQEQRGRRPGERDRLDWVPRVAACRDFFFGKTGPGDL